MSNLLPQRSNGIAVWKKLPVLCTVLLLVSIAFAQQVAPKRALTHNDYDTWRAIQGQSLSRDGGPQN